MVRLWVNEIYKMISNVEYEKVASGFYSILDIKGLFFIFEAFFQPKAFYDVLSIGTRCGRHFRDIVVKLPGL